jgi:hypothetical protein
MDPDGPSTTVLDALSSPERDPDEHSKAIRQGTACALRWKDCERAASGPRYAALQHGFIIASREPCITTEAGIDSHQPHAPLVVPHYGI